MKNLILFSAAIIMMLFVNNLIGRSTYNTNWIVPASVVDGDTIPFVTFPAIIIDGNAK